ncbi:uncharacterized protein Tco025E_05666 [Trypanosoma conorhini]|uniref:Uncharacterized protein n=1 Tax=Trypanosoma conorhini TaxID=83891 RepID=A0A3R7KX71_9TRYP|nr:uncharacterized protein Tco025E_05666 [Trypanosoma conorhini]RNF15220.1 hypothetical protein Tco025E_05666 [Trypanosoma conorhini]
MRGGFRRGRFDKVPQPGAVNSYSEALYPPRVYHHYTQQPSNTAPSLATIIVPSIDDGVGESRLREGLPHGVSTIMDKKTPPYLRDFVGCFIDGEQYLANSRAFAVLDSGKELLNVLHYPSLLGIDRKDQNIEHSITDKNAPPISPLGEQQMRHLEEALGLPAELRIYGLGKRSGEITSAAMDRLRIRPVKRKRIVKPIRRGTKVVVLPLAGAEDADEIKKARRVVGEEEELEGNKKTQIKRENDDHDEDGSGGGYDREDDEASLSFQVDDDDDGGDLDGPEGSGGEDNFF